MVIPIIVGTPGTIPKKFGWKRLDLLKIGGTFETSIVNIGQNTEKSPVDLRRLDVTETLAKYL